MEFYPDDETEMRIADVNIPGVYRVSEQGGGYTTDYIAQRLRERAHATAAQDSGTRDTGGGGGGGGGGSSPGSFDWNNDMEGASSPTDIYDTTRASNVGNTSISSEYSDSGDQSLAINIPAGAHWGGSLYYHFPERGFGSFGLDSEQPDAVSTGISIYLPSSWQQNSGDTAKLYTQGINLSAGNADSGGGGPPSGDDGWSVRVFSIGTGGSDVELANYTYHMDQGGQYGTEETFATVSTGEWHRIETYVELNTPGSANGVSRVWVNGTQEYERTDLRFRTTDELGFDSVGPAAYYGGSMTSPRNNTVYYDDHGVTVERVNSGSDDGDAGGE